MIKIRAWFEDTEITFSVRDSLTTNFITELAKIHLKEEGVSALLSEVQWETVQ